MQQNKMHNVFAKGQGLQKIATGYWDQMTFYLLVQNKVYKRGKSHNEHSNILCQQVVDSIPKESFNWHLQSFLSICQTLLLHKLAKPGYRRTSPFACLWSNLYFPIPLFRVFNPKTLVAVKLPLSSFHLKPFSFFFLLSVSFFIFFTFACQNHLFRFSTLTRYFPCHLKHNTSLLCRHWWDLGTLSHPFRWVSMLLLRKHFSQHRTPPSWVTIFHGGLADFGESVWALILLLEIIWVESSYHEPSSSSFETIGHENSLHPLFFDEVQLFISCLNPFSFFQLYFS